MQTHRYREEASDYQWEEEKGKGQYRSREFNKGLLQDYMKSHVYKV